MMWMTGCVGSSAVSLVGGGGMDAAASGGGGGEASRLFVLLAAAGMGKSIFSAVIDTQATVLANDKEANAILVSIMRWLIALCPT